MKQELVCIVCPLGCNIEVGFKDDGKEIEYIKGNTCKRGSDYAREECTNPVRMVTTTVRCKDGSVVPVKTSKAIEKGKIFECMKIINNFKADLPICTGDVIIKNVLDTGADIIATADSKL